MAQFDEKFKKIFGVKNTPEFPLVTLREAVIYPGIAVPIVVNRPKSLAAIEYAMMHDKVAVFVVQRNAEIEKPKTKDLYKIGTIAKIREVVKEKDGLLRVLVEGISRIKILEFTDEKPFFEVRVDQMPQPQNRKSEKIEALVYSVINQFKECVNLGASVPLDVLLVIVNMKDPWRLSDMIALNLDLKIEEKQQILESQTIIEKLQHVRTSLARQIKVLRIAKKLQTETGQELDKMQKEMFLREQLKSIEKELGITGGRTEIEELKEKIKKAGMPKKTKEKALKELERMERMPSFSPEISYIRTYLDWLISVPWNKKTKSKIDIKQSKKILDEDHFGLEKAKDRILEYLAVQKLVGKIKGPILCFYGPPGTGKTSIGKSISRALGREFYRMSLGGIRDEAEIRGHRRTYVGAMPGRIVQGLSNVKSKNPVFMLDEIDKVGNDFRGDPASALLEALDDEQNHEFVDNYLEAPFDLSDVMFLTTANMLDTIPPALRDRMEIIDFPGYTEDEKFNIVKKFLIPQALKMHGISSKNIVFQDKAIRKIIREYTLEAGLRNLERKIAKICRKVARAVSEGNKKNINLTLNLVEEYLGAPRIYITMAEKKDEVGLVTGLAWTPVGGDILHIETTKMPGKGNLILTGHLGQVMQESAQAAYTYTKSKSKKFKILPKVFKENDVHVHVPQGAIPKDGPSAGVAMATVLISLLTDRKIKKDVAMTGEITLRGKVLEIGGVKEKVLAAHRSAIKMVILPKNNKKDLVDVPKEVQKDLKFVFAETIDDVIKYALINKVNTKTKKIKKKIFNF